MEGEWSCYGGGQWKRSGQFNGVRKVMSQG